MMSGTYTPRHQIYTPGGSSKGNPKYMRLLVPARERKDKALEKTAARGQHLIAFLVTLPFAIWIAVEGTRGYFPVYAWAIPLAAAYYLGMRIGREIVRGWVRSRRGS